MNRLSGFTSWGSKGVRIMKIRLAIAALLGALGLASSALIAGQQTPKLGHSAELAIKALPPTTTSKLTVTSSAFKEGDDIPWEYTQYGSNTFPGLTWTDGPAGTHSYVLIVQGENPSSGGVVVSIHLTLFNLPAKLTALKMGMTAPPAGATNGENIHGFNQPYAGPHAHTAVKSIYHYQVFALDTVLDLGPSATFDTTVAAMTGHVLASGDLVGVSARKPDSTDAFLNAGPTRIETGQLSGTPGRDHSIMVYKGIPYAAPPVGDLRFRPPQPPIAWEGVRKADQYGKSCPQSGPKDNMSEDCLFANVWTGASFALERRPVYVWIYGGGFSGGSGSSPEFDGEALAKKGLVVVTFNYRLGALGFLSTPELSKESGHNASGNFGLMDDIALLQWVHKNITAFGGDPDKVTIGGQSAGAGSVGFLAMSPLAKGLFIRAIAESHARYARDTELRYLSVSWRSQKDAETAGKKWAEALGAHSLKDLRTMSWDQLIVPGNLFDPSIETGSDAKPPLFRPVIEGWVLPKDYSQTYASHSQNNVEFLTGNNRDESGAVPEDTFAKRRSATGPGAPGMPHVSVTVADFMSAAKRKFGALADEFLKLYPASNDDQAALQNNESVRDNSRISTYLWASDWKPGTDKPVYTYYWTHRPTGDPGGAHHASEILFAFNNLSMRNQPWTEEDRKVADIMSSYWANYITTGNPNGPGLPVWPAFDPKSPTVMEIGDHFGPTPVATESRLAFWKRFFETQKPW
jgi:para-nitrobenzyl esterase